MDFFDINVIHNHTSTNLPYKTKSIPLQKNQMNTVIVFWDDRVAVDRECFRASPECFLNSVILANPSLHNYAGNSFTFQYFEKPDSLLHVGNAHQPRMVFVLAELTQGNYKRSSLRGLHILKQLRKNRIKVPIILFSFLDDKTHLDFFDRHDYINTDYMQYFVHLPEIKLQHAMQHRIIRDLSDQEIENLLQNQFNKKRKAALLLDKLKSNLSMLNDNETGSAVKHISDTFNTMVKWVPDDASQPKYTTVIPNKLKRQKSQNQRITLLDYYRDDLIKGIVDTDCTGAQDKRGLAGH